MGSQKGRIIVKRAIAAFAVLFLVSLNTPAQQTSPPAPLPPPRQEQSAEFLHAADEVLSEMSALLSLPILTPLKKSLRSRDEIREYLVRKMKEDKNPQKRYSDQKIMEKFGLLPKNYPLEQTLLKVLTEQIAGLYDPDSKEFFIADWIAPADQRMVMSHELTHALQDQHFHIDPWTDAAKPNDDAELARDAVIEGSALAAMLDYVLRGKGSIRDLGELDPSMLMGDADTSPELSQAPKILRDGLLFPYMAGTTFTQRFLKTHAGWTDFHKIFENPPVSTQQIMHPDLYRQGIVPPEIALPEGKRLVTPDWKKLDENRMGEFGMLEVFKQFLEKDRSATLASDWSADRYAIYENQKTKRLILLFRIRLANPASAARFFGAYSEVLELKYQTRDHLLRRPNFFSFDTPEDGVFLRCMASDCLILEGSSREAFDQVAREIGWPAGPAMPVKPDGSRVRVAATKPQVIPGAASSFASVSK